MTFRSRNIIRNGKFGPFFHLGGSHTSSDSLIHTLLCARAGQLTKAKFLWLLCKRTPTETYNKTMSALKPKT